jgi:hypothetical protein
LPKNGQELILLVTTDLLRSDIKVSRWKDWTWLAWLAATAYLAHNVEEYGIDMHGNLHEFPTTMEKMLHAQPPLRQWDSVFVTVPI